MNILLVGAAGFNLGDDAIAATLATYLADRIGGAQITATTLNAGRLARLGVKEVAVNRNSIRGWLRLARSIRHSDLVLLGGGTLIQDALGCGIVRGMIPYIWQVSLLAKIHRRPVATVPIGIDNLKGRRAIRLARGILRRADLVLLRDQRSLDLAQRLLPRNRSRFILAADPVFGVQLPTTLLPEPEPYIVISHVKERRDGTAVENELKALITRVRSKWPSHKIVLLAMDTREVDELGVYRSVYQELGDDSIRIEAPADYRVAVRLIRGAKLVVAMRLHAMIMALGHVPLVGISRTTKTKTLIEDASIYGADIQSMNPEEIVQLARRALADEGRVRHQQGVARAFADRFALAMQELEKHCVSATYDRKGQPPFPQRSKTDREGKGSL